MATTTIMTREEVISVLNNLIETCRDGQTGFQTAAEGVANPSLKESFFQYAQQRGLFVTELQEEVRGLGGDPQTTGSVAAALHRGWINIKSAVTGQDEHNILEECERGEDSAMKNYQDALRQPLPPNIINLINRQYQDVVITHNTIRSWRDQTRAAHAAR
jgi:uncharacterized protein (TIGR02284 family)